MKKSKSISRSDVSNTYTKNETTETKETRRADAIKDDGVTLSETSGELNQAGTVESSNEITGKLSEGLKDMQSQHDSRVKEQEGRHEGIQETETDYKDREGMTKDDMNSMARADSHFKSGDIAAARREVSNAINAARKEAEYFNQETNKLKHLRDDHKKEVQEQSRNLNDQSIKKPGG